MEEEPTKDLATRAFQMRVLDEFGAIRRDLTEIRDQQTAMAKNIAALDQRLTSIEQRVTSIEQRVTSIEQHVTAIDQRLTSVDQRVTSIDQRLTTLEERVDRRLQETRPIWEAVQEQVQRLGEKLDAVLLDFYELREEMKIHGRRIGKLEGRVPL